MQYSLYKNTGANILKGGPIEEAQLMLDEHVVKTQNMLASAFAAPFQERLQIWLGKVRPVLCRTFVSHSPSKWKLMVLLSKLLKVRLRLMQ